MLCFIYSYLVNVNKMCAGSNTKFLECILCLISLYILIVVLNKISFGCRTRCIQIGRRIVISQEMTTC